MAWTVTVPANTPKDAPYVDTFDLTYGVLIDIGVRFWSGCLGNVGVRLYHHEFQIAPMNVSGWIVGDDEYVSTERFYVVKEEPFVLTVRAYNLDLNHSHDVLIRYGLYPVEFVFPNIEVANKISELQQTLAGIFGGAPTRVPETTS